MQAKMNCKLPSHRSCVAGRHVSCQATASKPLWLANKLTHVVDSGLFDRSTLNTVFAQAIEMEKVTPKSPESKMLEGFVMSTLFYEPSTRTRLSFESAMSRLGGSVVSTESAGEYSSAAKGETLEGE